MDPKVRRIIVPLIFILLAFGVVFTMVTRKHPNAINSSAPTSQSATQTPPLNPDSSSENASPEKSSSEPSASTPKPPPDSPNPETEETKTPPADLSADGLYAIAPSTGISGHTTPPASLGSLDPDQHRMLIEFRRDGAGIDRIVLSDQWQTWHSRKQAKAHHTALRKGSTTVPPLPPEEERYTLNQTRFFNAWSKKLNKNELIPVPLLAVQSITINGTRVSLYDYTTSEDGDKRFIWAEIAPGIFTTQVLNQAGDLLLDITRSFSLGDNGDITLHQSVINRTAEPLDIQWSQYGPGDLDPDRSKYIDRRRFRFGYLHPPQRDPSRRLVFADDNSVLIERTDITKRNKKAEEKQLARTPLWPNETSTKEQYELSWFAACNRYFTLAIHPLIEDPDRDPLSLNPVINEVRYSVSKDPVDNKKQTIFTSLHSPTRTLQPGETTNFDLGIYAGPLDRHILEKVQPYPTLRMGQLILYQMSSMCAICTFQWLAHILLGLLTFLHNYILFDWALAIIGLVCIVRTCLHPLLKKSQIGMQRMTKGMAALKPEMDKLQQKYPNDPKKVQMETMKLYREHGVNPLGCLNMLPMLLQSPIWIALYAMLYFTFDLRQDAGFFGLFQMIGGWPFLADLSASDHFFGEFATPRHFLLWNVTGINLLPILMGVMFFIQQKYMSPPPAPPPPKNNSNNRN